MRVEANLMENSRLEIANPDRVLGYVIPDVVGLAVGSGLDAGSGHPHGKGVRVMIASIEAFLQGGVAVVLHHGGASELTPPDDQRLLEESALLEVGDQTGKGLVDLPALDGEGLVDRFSGGGSVVIPAPVVELDEAYPVLDQTPRQKTIVGKGRIVALVETAGVCG